MSTLDNLKKAAKRWLRSLRANDPAARERLTRAYPGAPDEPRLRDLQHALARELGHGSWKALRDAERRVEADAASTPYARVSAPRVFDRLAQDVVSAYSAEDPDAVVRLSKFYGLDELTIEAFRAEIGRRLHELHESDPSDQPFNVTTAREIIARDAGYETWAALQSFLAAGGEHRALRMERVCDVSGELGPPIQPRELKPTLPMELQDGKYATTTTVWQMLVASRAGDVARVKELVAEEPGLVECYYNYMPPLHLAVREGHTELVELLLEKGALNAEDVTYPYNEVYLTLAKERGHSDIAKMLREFAGRPETTRRRSRRHGAGHIEFPTNVDEGELNRLVAANDLSALSTFVQSRPAVLGDELVNWGEGILSGLANRGNRPVIELLLHHGARVPDVTKWGRAYYFKHYFIAELLLEHGMNPNHMNWHRTTLLHEVVWEGDVRKAQLLVDYGADVDAIDEEFRSTPLGVAARWGRREMVKLLLDRGADPNRSGARWSKPLAWAEGRRHSDIARELRNAGAR